VIELDSVNLFRDLKRDEQKALASITQARQFAAGCEIFRQGDPGDGVYFVKSGQVEISGTVGANAGRVFSQFGPGEIFGEMAVVERRPRSATATALKDTELYFIPRDEMLKLIRRSPDLTFNLLKQVSNRLREFDRLHLREVIQAERLAVVGNFARAIVHDLKNPLAIIALSAEMFEMPGVRQELIAQAQFRIRKQVERINDMVSDILIFTRGASVNVKIKPADYHAFISGLLADLRAEAELKNVRIGLQGEPPAARAQFDPKLLGRVFYNLVNNATDAMPNGGKIFLRFHCNDKEIVTEIEDTGPGIAPEIAGKLFQDFATFGKEHGTGLGLSICKKIIEDHKGRIWACNKADRGAIFCFTLPLAK
jgi:signal transduction histidine kinase